MPDSSTGRVSANARQGDLAAVRSHGMKEVVGIDPSLTSTGVATPSGVLAVSVHSKGVVRLLEMRDAVMGHVAVCDDPLVMLEGYSFSSRNSHAHALGELGGVFRVALFEFGVPYVEVPPTCRAKFATGRGNAGKGEVMSSVSARTGIAWSGKGAEDMCDAWVLQEMGLALLGRARYEWPRENLAALEKISLPDISEG